MKFSRPHLGESSFVDGRGCVDALPRLFSYIHLINAQLFVHPFIVDLTKYLGGHKISPWKHKKNAAEAGPPLGRCPSGISAWKIVTGKSLQTLQSNAAKRLQTLFAG